MRSWTERFALLSLAAPPRHGSDDTCPLEGLESSTPVFSHPRIVAANISATRDDEHDGWDAPARQAGFLGRIELRREVFWSIGRMLRVRRNQVLACLHRDCSFTVTGSWDAFVTHLKTHSTCGTKLLCEDPNCTTEVSHIDSPKSHYNNEHPAFFKRKYGENPWRHHCLLCRCAFITGNSSGLPAHSRRKHPGQEMKYPNELLHVTFDPEVGYLKPDGSCYHGLLSSGAPPAASSSSGVAAAASSSSGAVPAAASTLAGSSSHGYGTRSQNRRSAASDAAGSPPAPANTAAATHTTGTPSGAPANTTTTPTPPGPPAATTTGATGSSAAAASMASPSSGPSALTAPATTLPQPSWLPGCPLVLSIRRRMEERGVTFEDLDARMEKGEGHA